MSRFIKWLEEATPEDFAAMEERHRAFDEHYKSWSPHNLVSRSRETVVAQHFSRFRANTFAVEMAKTQGAAAPEVDKAAEAQEFMLELQTPNWFDRTNNAQDLMVIWLFTVGRAACLILEHEPGMQAHGKKVVAGEGGNDVRGTASGGDECTAAESSREETVAADGPIASSSGGKDRILAELLAFCARYKSYNSQNYLADFPGRLQQYEVALNLRCCQRGPIQRESHFNVEDGEMEKELPTRPRVQGRDEETSLEEREATSALVARLRNFAAGVAPQPQSQAQTKHQAQQESGKRRDEQQAESSRVHPAKKARH
ncbi:uncharacterized protein PFL1_05356 [Pseudozyma flocculosa PF-1]|uniref:Uncharacterized protein n=1 Tax=Pseudozyma flocculosa PF-1 TaxID=1277687 RepID=A0A061H2W1_9BASI|nr:uncharacterized protein PFL1_05356 [Pseudozyma flocculosa PF-1]EPQ27072.1 hypothetical protein PFL1_05356 [Pseudozyma flocculosa PF-1]